MKQDKAGHIVIFITAGDRDEAGRISRRLIEERLAACVNIMPGVASHYRWRGRPEAAEECLLIAKTRARLLDDVVAAVKEVHSYEVPEIIALPVIGGSRDYLDWIDREVRPQTGRSNKIHR